MTHAHPCNDAAGVTGELRNSKHPVISEAKWRRLMALEWKIWVFGAKRENSLFLRLEED